MLYLVEEISDAEEIEKREDPDRFPDDLPWRNRVEYLRVLKSEPCLDCGNRFPPEAMDFDHRPGTEKFGQISQLCREQSWSAVLEEIEKCDVVCSNCHRVRTSRRTKSPRHAAWIADNLRCRENT